MLIANAEVEQHTWIVFQGTATPEGMTESVISYLANGVYAGEAVELVWQYKEPHEQYWLSIEESLEIPPYMRNKDYNFRQLLRAVTSFKTKFLKKQQPFQVRATEWAGHTFGQEVVHNLFERRNRFAEEATELLQSVGMPKEDLLQLIEHVYGKPIGDPHQEMGGVVLTLNVLGTCIKSDVAQDAETELARVWSKVNALRDKHNNKPVNSPLPHN